MARDPVLQYAGEIRRASERYDIPPEVLAGLIHVESGGRIGAVSSAQAFGLTQFIPSTARSYGVRRGDPRSQIDGAARYLRDLGFHRDPKLALASYNAGPGNPGAAGNYPDKVLAAAKRYTGLSRGQAAPDAPAAPTDPAAAAQGSGEPTALPFLVKAVFVLGGAAIAWVGVARATGIRPSLPGPLKAVT